MPLGERIRGRIRHGLYNPLAVDPTLVLDLPLSEGVGNTAYDRSLYGNHGTIYGATWVDSKMGKALRFDGLNDYVRVSASASLNNLQSFTYMAWVYVMGTVPGFSSQILSKFQKVLALAPAPERELSASVQFSTSSADSASLETTPLNTWFHAIATFQNGEDVVKLYLNRAECTYDYQIAGVGTLLDDDTYDLTLGVYYAFPWNWLNGILHEVRVYNRVLSVTEILRL